MRKDTQHAHLASDAGVITLSLSEDQLHAIGLNRLPAPGAEVHLRATATVQRGNESEDTQDGDQDGDPDADQDGDNDARGADAGEAGEENARGEENTSGAGRTALTLRLSGLTLTPLRQAPDKVLYGSGD